MSDNNRLRPYAVVAGNLNLVRCLGHAGIPVFCATSDANRIAFSSRYVCRSHKTPSPTQSPSEFVGELVQIGRHHLESKGVLYYDGDGDLIAISENRSRLEEYYDFVIPDHSLVETLLDKRRFSKFAEERGLNVPKTYYSDDASHDFPDLKPEDFPILVKPQTRVGWLDNSASWLFAQGGKAFSVENRVQLDDLLEKLEGFDGGMILQQMIPGPESQIFSYHAFSDRTGKVLAEFCGKKHCTFPIEYGRSAFIEIFDDARLTEIGREYIAKVGVTGVVKLDFKLDTRSGEYYLLEINSRFSIWNWPGAIAGRNLPAIAYQTLAGEQSAGKQAPIRTVYWADGRAHRKAATGSGNWRPHFLSYIGKPVVFNIWSLSDPLPFVASCWNSLIGIPWRIGRRLWRRAVS